VFCVFSVAGQQDSLSLQYDTTPFSAVKKISETDLQPYKNDPKFDYEVVKLETTWWDEFKSWLGNQLLRFFEWIFGIEKAEGFLSGFFQILPYLLIGILLYILIKFFLNVNANVLRQAKAEGSLVSLSDEEQIIKHEDIQELIRKAVLEKDYRSAIRYYYLLILKKMGERELILWAQQKTNDDYIKELQSSDLLIPFNTITRLYDYIWYGSFALDEAKYLKARQAFLNLHKKLGNDV
tara:strand:- start:877 stop:1587 length:711 start_codon:yes stop_codon:yes gene_type:complete